MKNIHVLSTNKQSRLWTNNLRRRLELDEFHSKHQTNIAKHIYITNDEEIKEGDYMYDIDGDVGKAIGSDMKEFEGNKKIILTTDLDLIADGVQAIDDDFLEWFVKNPSCEFVEVEKGWEGNGTIFGFKMGNVSNDVKWIYKIIIPKEEPKQELERGITITHVGKQETLEEAVERLYPFEIGYCVFDINHKIDTERDAFIAGAKCQKEKSYSEEEAGELVYNIIGEYAKEYGITIDGAKLNDLFNQLKKQ
jgi:hypothetical protein